MGDQPLRRTEGFDSCSSHSLVFFRTEGVESVKVLGAMRKRTVMVWFHLSGGCDLLCKGRVRLHPHLMGWGGQLGCTGVWTAELGLINMAL